jgi:transcription initiation factor TFIID/TFIIF subunit
MVEVKRTVRFTTTQHVLKDIPPVQEGFPMREWSIQVSLVNDKGVEVPATIFDKVTYALHPTFTNPVRSFKKPPFTIQEQGWGGFDIPITLTLIEKGGDKKMNHDLNFYKEKYVIDKQITINTTKPNLLKELAKSGPIPGSAASTPSNVNASNTPLDSTANTQSVSSPNTTNINGGTPVTGSTTTDKRKGAAVSSNEPKNVKRAKTTANKGGVDLEKMADYLGKLKEDDLLGVVQMINDNRTPEMNIKNDVDNGEFTMDLYTLPDTLLKSLWDYVKKRAE